MKARVWKRRIAVAAAVYGTVWLATWLYGAEIVRERVEHEAHLEWEPFRPTKKADPRMERWRVRLSYREGPRISFEDLSFPCPTIVRADIMVMVGSSSGHSFIGWYLVTPWRDFLLKRTSTGIS